MADYYRATSTKNPERYVTSGVILSKDNQGNPTKEITVGGEPVELSDDEVKKVREYLNVSKVDESKVENEDENVGQPVDEVTTAQPTADPTSVPPASRKSR